MNERLKMWFRVLLFKLKSFYSTEHFEFISFSLDLIFFAISKLYHMVIFYKCHLMICKSSIFVKSLILFQVYLAFFYLKCPIRSRRRPIVAIRVLFTVLRNISVDVAPNHLPKSSSQEMLPFF